MTAPLSHFRDPANALDQVERLLVHEGSEIPLKIDSSLLNEVTDLLSEVSLGRFKAELTARWVALENQLLSSKRHDRNKEFDVIEFLKDMRTAADAARDPIHSNLPL